MVQRNLHPVPRSALRRTRGPSKIRAGQLKSLLRAVTGAGVKVTRIEVDQDGRIAMTTSDARDVPSNTDSLDQELAEFEDRFRGHS